MTAKVASNSRARSIGIKIAIAARHMRQLFDERVESHGVTRAKWNLIATVASRPGATQRSIASALEISDVTAGRLIDRVCADGLLERRENPTDRRAYCVYLTDAAQPTLELLSGAALEYERDLFANFSEAEMDQLDALLEKMASNITSLRSETGERKALAAAS
jgi:MarR family transcriptional regulator for hemolysin